MRKEYGNEGRGSGCEKKMEKGREADASTKLFKEVQGRSVYTHRRSVHTKKIKIHQEDP
jgi:hypothetical protein